jgi:hypothetical protein
MITKCGRIAWIAIGLWLAVAAGCNSGGERRVTGTPEGIASDKTVAAAQVVVVSADSIASRVGVDVLRRGVLKPRVSAGAGAR